MGEFPANLQITGAETTVLSMCMGTFSLMLGAPRVTEHDGRQVYEKRVKVDDEDRNPMYLYYWSPTKSWNIGENCRYGTALLFANSTAVWPVGVGPWQAHS